MAGNAEYIDQSCDLYPDRFHEPTYRGQIDDWKNQPPKRIDYIFKRHGQPLQVTGMDVIFNDHYYPTVSDNFGYLARYRLFG